MQLLGLQLRNFLERLGADNDEPYLQGAASFDRVLALTGPAGLPVPPRPCAPAQGRSALRSKAANLKLPAEWTAARELPDADYPLVLDTGRLLEHWHTGSMTRRARALDSIEPESFVGFTPTTPARSGSPTATACA